MKNDGILSIGVDGIPYVMNLMKGRSFMKHVFVINPAAGRANAFDAIKSALNELNTSLDYELYQTRGQGDATAFVRAYCQKYADPVRFYACGGDGTLNEVVNGAYGFAQASVACYPSGSGNDFVKYYGGKEAFLNLAELTEAPEEYIDLIRVGDRYAINAAHFGFDSCVAKTMMRVRRKKLIGGKRAYATGVLMGLLCAMRNACRVSVDGELLNPRGYLLLCTIANGQYVGGSYRCAPRSLNNDGMLEICLIRPISHFTFLRLMKDYERGLHLDNPVFDRYIEYRRGHSVTVEAPEGFVYSFDGELIEQNRFTVETVERAIRFAVPRSARPLNPQHTSVDPEKSECLTV